MENNFPTPQQLASQLQAQLQPQFEPLAKLTQSNIALMTEFSTSPEVISELTAGTTRLVQQANETTMKLIFSGAFVSLAQGLMRNYSDFMLSCGQSALTLMNERQLALAGQMQQAAADAVTVPVSGKRRGVERAAH